MPRFHNLTVDWSTHTELNTDMLEQSAHGMKEQPEDCTCDFCAEESFFEPGNSSKTARCTTNSVTTFSRFHFPIEESKIPPVDGCKCHRLSCHKHQFHLSVVEWAKLMMEYSKLMDDWAFTLQEGEKFQLQDFHDLHLRHCQFLKRLSDAGIPQKYRNINFSSLTNAYDEEDF